jgi:hypothetical protein
MPRAAQADFVKIPAVFIIAEAVLPSFFPCTALGLLNSYRTE